MKQHKDDSAISVVTPYSFPGAQLLDPWKASERFTKYDTMHFL